MNRPPVFIEKIMPVKLLNQHQNGGNKPRIHWRLEIFIEQSGQQKFMMSGLETLTKINHN